MTPTGYHVTWMTRRQADAHERLCRSIGPGIRLGWTPYTIRVTYGHVTPQTAFTTAREFRQWLRRHGYRVRLTGRFAGSGRGNRTGVVLGPRELRW